MSLNQFLLQNIWNKIKWLYIYQVRSGPRFFLQGSGQSRPGFVHFSKGLTEMPWPLFTLAVLKPLLRF